MESNKDFTGSARYESDRHDHSVEPKHPNERPEHKIDPQVELAAAAFYRMFRSACHGISLRQELEQLYNATYTSFLTEEAGRPEFSKVLFAMARSLKVLRVIKGGTISWKALSRPRYDDRQQDDRRPRFDDHRQDDRRQDDHRPRFDDYRQDDHRPRFDDRRQDDRRPRFDDRRQDDRRPRFDDYRREDRQDDRRPRFDDRRQDDRRPRFDDRRRDEQQPTREPLRAVSVERQ